MQRQLKNSMFSIFPLEGCACIIVKISEIIVLILMQKQINKRENKSKSVRKHSFGAYYWLFLCNKIVITSKSWSECQFFSKKAKIRNTNGQKTTKFITSYYFYCKKLSPKSIVLRTYAVDHKVFLVKDNQ